MFWTLNVQGRDICHLALSVSLNPWSPHDPSKCVIPVSAVRAMTYAYFTPCLFMTVFSDTRPNFFQRYFFEILNICSCFYPKPSDFITCGHIGTTSLISVSLVYLGQSQLLSLKILFLTMYPQIQLECIVNVLIEQQIQSFFVNGWLFLQPMYPCLCAFYRPSDSDMKHASE